MPAAKRTTLFFMILVIFMILVSLRYSAPRSYPSRSMRIVGFPYAIPDECIVSAVPKKIRVLSEVIPGKTRNYSYKAGQEQEYYKQYQESRFAITTKKGGWDCLRHYEILAAGCIPLFQGLEECPDDTLVTFPKQLVLEANQKLWPWVDTPERVALYNSYVDRLLAHCRKECSTSALADRFMELAGQPRSVLMLACDPGENYSRELLAIGLRRRLGNLFLDEPRLDVLYKGCDLSKKYGNGFTYGGRLEAIEVGRRENLIQRIQAREFDVIIYGKVGVDEKNVGSIPDLPYWGTVSAAYPKEKLFFLYGGDKMQDLRLPWQQHSKHLLRHAEFGTCLVRELTL